MIKKIKERLTDAEAKRIVLALAVLAVFSALLGLFNNIEKVPLINSSGKTYAKAEVVEVLSENAAEGGGSAGAKHVMLEIKSGAHKGETIEAFSSDGYLYGADSRPGMTVMAVISEANGEIVASVGGVYRGGAIALIAVIFVAGLWLIGGKKGLLAIIGLAFTLVTIAGVFLPMIYRGSSPFLAAVVSCIITTAVCMPLIGGRSKKTAAAVISSVAGVVIAGVFAFLFGRLADVSGYNVSEIDELMFIAANTRIEVGELLFAGILIASMGAVMDVAMSVVSAVEEIHRKNPDISGRELFVSGMNVGKDTIGTMTNTLILAFVGSSVNTLVSIYAYDYPLMYTMNLYSTCIEIIRGLSGSMGVIFTVPIAAASAAFLYECRYLAGRGREAAGQPGKAR